MNRLTKNPTQKEAMSQEIRGLSSHTAVQNSREHEMPTNASLETLFNHDFSRVAGQLLTSGFGLDYSNVSCPLFHQSCPFGDDHQPQIQKDIHFINYKPLHILLPNHANADQQETLKIGHADSLYEREAERVAQLVTNDSNPIELARDEIDSIKHSYWPTLQRQPDSKLELDEEPKWTQQWSEEELDDELLDIFEEGTERRLERLEKEELERLEEEERRGVHIQTKPSNMQTPLVDLRLEKQIHSTLRLGGRPMPQPVLKYFEPRFGYDFRRVHIHTDAQAAKTANALNANAYTIGNNIVFGTSQFAPETADGKKLLGHELVHVIQQSKRVSDNTIQREQVSRPRPAAVNAAAQAIIDLAQDASRPLAARAVAVVQRIISQYFSAYASMIDGVVYDASLGSGLDVTSVGTGPSTRGRIGVSQQFVTDTTQRYFARRVLQVRHEISHIQQYRAGMTGSHRQHEREFLAFYHEATSPELQGTGRMQHSTRVQLIDAALRHYYCLSSNLRNHYSSQRDTLVTRRTEEVRLSNRSNLGSAPGSCTP